MGDRPRDHQSDAHPGDPPGLEEADPDGTSMGREIISDQRMRRGRASGFADTDADARHEEIGRATSELQSLMRISYAVFCLKKKKNQILKKHEQKKTEMITEHKTQSK